MSLPWYQPTMFQQSTHYKQQTLDIINFVMEPFSITSNNWGEFNVVTGGGHFVILNLLRAAQAQRESGVNFRLGKSMSLSRCSLYNRNG